jgi:hypothetical protein
VGATIRIAVLAQAAAARRELEDLGSATQGIGEKVKAGLGNLAGMAKAGAAGVGLVIGAALVAGVGQALEQGQLNAKLGAQLGLSKDEAKKVGKLAGSVYADGFGEDVGQVNDAIKGVYQNIGEGNEEWTRKITSQVLTVANVFEQDLGGTTAAVGQLLRTGLAKDADEALDVLTRGFQTGADKAGDLLDTFTEYGTQFRKFGLDATAATGLLSQGLQAGARDADTVADAIKEFSILALDGNKKTAAAFESLGLSARQMTADIAGGGPKAAAALDSVLDRLRAVKDPAERARLAVALFGTKAEDLGDALFALDPSSAVQAMGQVEGAAKRAGDTIGDTAAAKIEKFKRSIQQGFVEGLGAAIGAAESFLKKVPPSVWDQISSSVDALGESVGRGVSAWRDLTSAATGGMSGQEMLMQTLRGVRAVIDGLVVAVDGLVIAYKLSESGVYALIGGYKLLTGDLDGAKAAFGRSKQAADEAGEAIVQSRRDVSALAENWRTGGAAIQKANEDAARVAVASAKQTGDAHDRAGTTAAAAHAAAAVSAGRSQTQIGVDAQRAAQQALTGHQTSAGQVPPAWSNARDKISGVFSNVGGLLVSAGRSIMGGLLSGLEDGWARVRSFLSSVTSQIPSWKGPPAKDRLLLRGSGQLVMGGFLFGLESQYGDVRQSLAGFTDSLSASADVGGALGAASIDVTRPIGGAQQQAPIVLELKPSGGRLEDLLLELFRKSVRARGGNVQVALMGR